VANDYLDLKVPIYDTDITWMSNHVFYLSTGYGQIRSYDVRAKA
jgi:hypothetical protein